VRVLGGEGVMEGGSYSSYTSHRNGRIERKEKELQIFRLHHEGRKEVGEKDGETAWVVHRDIEYKYRVTDMFCLMHLHAT
jgi:Glu-tRNA(Gln) amidotransferase subunit E-like FAD-binding protein